LLQKEFNDFSRDNRCAYFEFMTLYEGHGLGKHTDGILGLAPQASAMDRDKNYIWQLYNEGVISKPILSFSMASSEMSDKPYALFGGFNSSQIVLGEAGLQTFRNSPGSSKSTVRSWALETKDLLYGDHSL
jgi:hypothetical protein